MVRPGENGLRLRRRLLTIAACAVVCGLLWGLSFWPAALESIYAHGLGFQIARVLSFTSGILPISLAELSLAALVLGALTTFVRSAIGVVQRRRSVISVLVNGSLRVMVFAAVTFTVFYLSWGLNYSRAPIAGRLGWLPLDARTDDTVRQREIDEIATFTRDLVEATNLAYRAMAGSDDLGRPTGSEEGVGDLRSALDAGYEKVQARLGLEPAVGAARGRPKPILGSALLNHLRLTGFYFPWTGEANYNRLMPAAELPRTIAHEQGHQRGYAREDEANFLGYLACILSAHPLARYSGYLFGQEQLLRELIRRDLPRYREIAAQRSPGVKRDLDYIRAYWSQFEGAAARVSLSVNDIFIRAHGDRRGVAAYAASRNLIVLFARSNGGSAVVSDDLRGARLR